MRQKRSGLCAWGIVLLLALLVPGCKGVPRRYVVGTWAIRADTRAEMPPNLINGSGNFTFNRNGTFTALQVPGLFYSQESSTDATGIRKWELANRQSREPTIRPIGLSKNRELEKPPAVWHPVGNLQQEADLLHW